MFAADATIDGRIVARFMAIVAPDGSTVAYLTTVDEDEGNRFSMRFDGQSRSNRIRAVAADGTELTATLHQGRLVGTVGSVGWVGTVTNAGTATVDSATSARNRPRRA